MRCRLQAGSRGGGSATVWREARGPGPCLARAPLRHWAGRDQGPAGASRKSASSKALTSLDTAAQGPGSGLAPQQVVGPRSRGPQTHREGRRGCLHEAHPRSEFHLFVDGNGPRAQGSGTRSRPGPRLAGSPLPTRRPACAPSQEPRAQWPAPCPPPPVPAVAVGPGFWVVPRVWPAHPQRVRFGGRARRAKTRLHGSRTPRERALGRGFAVGVRLL